MKQSRRELKKQRRNKIWMGALTIIIMVGGGLGIFANNISPSSSDLPYGDYAFNKEQNYWATELNGHKLYFAYHPFEVEMYNLSKDSVDLLRNSQAIIISNDPNSQFRDQIARVKFNFAESIGKMIGKQTINAFSVETAYAVPVLNCDNASVEIPVIMFEEGETEIVEDGNCIHLYSRSEADYTKLTDRLLYGVTGIIE